MKAIEIPNSNSSIETALLNAFSNTSFPPPILVVKWLALKSKVSKIDIQLTSEILRRMIYAAADTNVL
ncbi:MAG: hypothetical protein QW674_04830 [Candidatus Bathyarchaeia archaeon]